MDEYEYGILYVRIPEEPHRTGMTFDAALAWRDEWIKMGANPAAIKVIRRRISPWEEVVDH